MTLAMIFFAATWFSVVHKKRLKNRYLNTHHTLGSLGVLFAIIGLVIGIIMVRRLGLGHIRVAHSLLATVDLVLGALAIVLIAATVLVGLAYVLP